MTQKENFEDFIDINKEDISLKVVKFSRLFGSLKDEVIAEPLFISNFDTVMTISKLKMIPTIPIGPKTCRVQSRVCA